MGGWTFPPLSPPPPYPLLQETVPAPTVVTSSQHASLMGCPPPSSCSEDQGQARGRDSAATPFSVAWPMCLALLDLTLELVELAKLAFPELRPAMRGQYRKAVVGEEREEGGRGGGVEAPLQGGGRHCATAPLAGHKAPVLHSQPLGTAKTEPTQWTSCWHNLNTIWTTTGYWLCALHISKDSIFSYFISGSALIFSHKFFGFQAKKGLFLLIKTN